MFSSSRFWWHTMHIYITAVPIYSKERVEILLNLEYRRKLAERRRNSKQLIFSMILLRCILTVNHKTYFNFRSRKYYCINCLSRLSSEEAVLNVKKKAKFRELSRSNPLWTLLLMTVLHLLQRNAWLTNTLWPPPTWAFLSCLSTCLQFNVNDACWMLLLLPCIWKHRSFNRVYRVVIIVLN